MRSSALKLNDFQRLMRRWTALGAYNAIHALRLRGAADVEKWRGAVEKTLRETGLGIPDGGDREVTFSDFERVEIGCHPERSNAQRNAVEGSREKSREPLVVPRDPSTPLRSARDDLVIGRSLDDAIHSELNAPFPADSIPLRFSIIAGSDDHWLIVAFDHWLADSRSIRALMQRLHGRYAGLPALPSLMFGERHPVKWARGLFRVVRSFFEHAHSHRPVIANPLDFETGFLRRELPPRLIFDLRVFASESGATVNDIFLAAAAQSLGALIAPARTGSRDGVGIATAVDLRPSLGDRIDNAFGFYLSHFTLVIPHPETQPFASLLAEISRRTRALKTGKAPLELAATFTLARRWWDWSRKPWRRALMFHRGFPLLCGISNVNLTASWAGTTPGVLDYIRVSPTGSLLPLVFTLTTIAERLSLCVTFRRTIFSDSTAATLADDFITRLTRLRICPPFEL